MVRSPSQCTVSIPNACPKYQRFSRYRCPPQRTADCLLVLPVAGKILAYDTLYRTIEGIIEADKLVVLNWQFAAGVALGVICLLFALVLSRRGRYLAIVEALSCGAGS